METRSLSTLVQNNFQAAVTTTPSVRTDRKTLRKAVGWKPKVDGRYTGYRSQTRRNMPVSCFRG